MEETKKAMEEKKEEVTYEQLMATAKQLYQRANMAEQKLMAINLTTMRLQYLFMILDKADHFPAEYVKKTSEEIMDLLEVKEDAEEVKE